MIGTRLAHYEITSHLGTGGMGEVYQATDAKLGRRVAIKLLPEVFSHDNERVARFEREARVLASLNHPNIAAIYGVEESGGRKFLVMELVGGETLAEKTARGALPMSEALEIAAQIAEALEAAHEKGVIHRDLKPANVKVTPEGKVKVLDFGLAKAFEAEGSSASFSNSPTISIAATEQGAILGSAGYMAPEQAHGRPVDKRADIWAFGVVLYEMLAGERLFRGDSVTDLLASVLRQEPDWSRVSAQAVPLLRRCLERDPKRRLRDIGDAMALLEPALLLNASGSGAVRPGRRWVWPLVAAIVVGIAVAALLWPRTIDRPLLRLNVDLGPDAESSPSSTVAISPDGSRIVFLKRTSGGGVMLATRLLSETMDTPLPGTEGAFDAFFSPDGLAIGFFASDKLQKITLQGGSRVPLADAPVPRGASWGDDGSIAAALLNTTGISLLPMEGGTPRRLTELKPGEATHRWPQILPGSQAALFTNSSNVDIYEDATIDSVSLKTGERRTLVKGGYFGRYVPSNGSTGHLVYVHQGGVFAVKFDPARLEVQGTPVSLFEDLATNPTTGGGHFDFSQTISESGTFVYRSGQASGGGSWQLAWMDSSGKADVFLKPGVYVSHRLSPDGRRLAFGVTNNKGTDLAVYDFENDNMSARTFSGQDNSFPVWTPDGRFLIFRSARPTEGLYAIRSDGAGEAQMLLGGQARMVPTSVSPDGKRLAYQVSDAETATDLWTVPLDWTDPNRPKAGPPELFVRAPGIDRQAAFSPDGRWIAYESSVSGRGAIYVRASPGSTSGKWLITDGSYPVWSKNGRELFFESLGDNRIWVVDYTARDGVFSAGKPRQWSSTPLFDNNYWHKELAPDGKRFVVVTRPTPQGASSIHVTFLLNFFDELRRKLP